MTERTAKGLATTLGGDAVFPTPRTRTWGFLVTCPDGRLVAIEDGSGWAYRDRAAYDAFQTAGDDSGLVATGEWPHWGVTEGWARSLAKLLGGEPHQSGGNIWVVLFHRWDGRFVVVGDDGAELYQSANHYDRYYEIGQPEPDYVYWTD